MFDYLCWWTGFCAIAFVSGAVVLAVADKFWTATMQVWMYLKCPRKPNVAGLRYLWAVVRFWKSTLFQVWRDDLSIGPFKSCSIGGYELHRPFGIPRKIRGCD